MKNNYLFPALLSFLSLISVPATSQECHWVQRTSSVQGYQEITSHASDSKGNTYVAGYATKNPMEASVTLTLDSITVTKPEGFYYIARYNNYGRIKWVKFISGGNTKMAVDRNGYVYLTGYFAHSPITFGPYTLQPADTSLTYNYNMFVAKMDSVGNFLWARSAGLANKEVEPSAIVTDKDNNILVAGNFTGTGITFGTAAMTLSGNAFLTRYNSSGTLTWARGMGCTTPSGAMGTRPLALTTDRDGNIFVTGEYLNPSICFDAISIAKYTGASSNTFIAKYNPSGTIQWARSGGGGEWDRATGVAADSRGNAYMVGMNYSSKGYYGTHMVNNGGSASNLLIVKYGKNGDVVWAKTMGGGCASIASAVAINNEDQLFVLGAIGDHPYGIGSYPLIGNGKVLLRMDTNAVISCGFESGAGAVSSMWPFLSLDNTGYAVISGRYNMECTFGSITVPCNSSQNTFVAKVSCGPLPSGFLETHKFSTAYSIHPNPADNDVFVDGITGSTSYSLLSCLGKVVAEGVLTEHHNSFFIGQLPPGIYLIRLTDGVSGDISTIKLAKQ